MNVIEEKRIEPKSSNSNKDFETLTGYSGLIEKGSRFDPDETFYIRSNSGLPDNYIEVLQKLDDIVSLISFTIATKDDVSQSTTSILNEQKKEFMAIQELINENNKLRNLLDEKYTGKELLIWSSLLSIALIITLIGWFSFKINLIHPVISIPLLIGSLGFVALAIWKIR